VRQERPRPKAFFLYPKQVAARAGLASLGDPVSRCIERTVASPHPEQQLLTRTQTVRTGELARDARLGYFPARVPDWVRVAVGFRHALLKR
jgi:hypothetical protein